MVQCFSSFSTHLKNISQIGSFAQVGLKIKHIWNHHQVLNLIQHFVSTDQVWLSAFCILKYILKWEICTSLRFISSSKKRSHDFQRSLMAASQNSVATWRGPTVQQPQPKPVSLIETTQERCNYSTTSVPFPWNFSSLSSLSYSFHR